MLGAVANFGIRWQVEVSTLMGELYIEKPNGESLTIQLDGTEIRNEPIQIEWCDKCERWQPLEFGRHEKAGGLTILWFCDKCK